MTEFFLFQKRKFILLFFKSNRPYVSDFVSWNWGQNSFLSHLSQPNGFSCSWIFGDFVSWIWGQYSFHSIRKQIFCLRNPLENVFFMFCHIYHGHMVCLDLLVNLLFAFEGETLSTVFTSKFSVFGIASLKIIAKRLRSSPYEKRY